MRPRAAIDLRVTVVEQRGLLGEDVETETTVEDTPFVPETACEHCVRHAECVDFRAFCDAGGAVHVFGCEDGVEDVGAVGVGHDVRYACCCGGAEDVAVDGWGSWSWEGDDEELLVVESGDEGGGEE